MVSAYNNISYIVLTIHYNGLVEEYIWNRLTMRTGRGGQTAQRGMETRVWIMAQVKCEGGVGVESRLGVQ